MVHDVYDAEMWAMIDQEDALLASYEQEVYEYRKEEEVIISKQNLWTKIKQFIMRVNSKSTTRKAD